MANNFIDKDYLMRCSQKTLQTNEKGFFLQFADHVADAAGSNWIKNVFGKLKTDRERITIIYQYQPVKDALCETLSHVQEIYRKKSAEVAQKRRFQAEEFLEKRESSKALILGSQSVLRAPPTEHVKGAENVPADALTRVSVITDFPITKFNLKDIAAQQANDSELEQLLKHIILNL